MNLLYLWDFPQNWIAVHPSFKKQILELLAKKINDNKTTFTL